MYARTYPISLHWLHCLLRSGKRIFKRSLKENRASLVAQRLKRLPAMQETWVWSLGQEDHLEKEMATHSSILPWRIPWTEEPVGYSPWGSEEFGHDWVTSLSVFNGNKPTELRPSCEATPNPKLFFPHSLRQLKAPPTGRTKWGNRCLARWFLIIFPAALFFIFPENFFAHAILTQENWSHSCHRMDERRQNYKTLWMMKGGLLVWGGQTHLLYRSQPQNVLTLLYLNNFIYLWMEYKPACNQKWLLFLLWPDQPASSSVASATIYFSPIPLEIIVISFCLAFSFSLSKTQFPIVYTILYITFFHLRNLEIFLCSRYYTF